MLALVDINSCYCSCEEIFNPKIKGKPIVVLSNNDGCVIARNNPVKKLGIEMGVPAYQIEEQVKRYGIEVFSSNYQLYGDMSTRLMATLQTFVQDMEVYSIDEAFLDMTGFEHLGLKQYGEKIVKTILRDTGLPVSMGIAPTKTLCKVANKFSKKHKGYNGVCIIDNDEKLIKALKLTDISDLWGVGRRLTRRMNYQGIKTAYDITQASRSFMRKHYTVTGERMWMELQGIKCYGLEENPPKKQQICTSRAFGDYVRDIEGMRECVSTYATICAEELRQQGTFASELMVFIHTNHFNETHDQYAQNCVIKLPVATNSTLEIVTHAMKALRYIYRPGYLYKKAGVIITEITRNPSNNLFRQIDHEKHGRLMQVIDKYNKGFISDKIKLAVQGTGGRDWKLKQERLSPRYTTQIKEVIRINCNI